MGNKIISAIYNFKIKIFVFSKTKNMNLVYEVYE